MYRLGVNLFEEHRRIRKYQASHIPSFFCVFFSLSSFFFSNVFIPRCEFCKIRPTNCRSLSFLCVQTVPDLLLLGSRTVQRCQREFFLPFFYYLISFLSFDLTYVYFFIFSPSFQGLIYRFSLSQFETWGTLQWAHPEWS